MINGRERLMTELWLVKIYMKHVKFVKTCTWRGPWLPRFYSRDWVNLFWFYLTMQILMTTIDDLLWKWSLTVTENVKAEQNLTLTLTKPLNSNVNSLIWVSIFVVSWLTWIFWAENKWKLVLTFKHIFKGCSSGSGFQTASAAQPYPLGAAIAVRLSVPSWLLKQTTE